MDDPDPPREFQSGIGLNGLNPVQVATFQGSVKLRAIVVIIGDIGQSESDLGTVAQAYHKRKCASITVSRTIFANTNEAIDKYANQVLEQSYKLLSKYDGTPLIMHIFGNGGGYVLKRVEEMMTTTSGESTSPAASATEPLLEQPEQLLAQRLKKGGIIYDSAPAYPNLLARLQEARAAIPHPVVFFALCMWLIFYHIADKLVLRISSRYWKHMTTHKPTLREAYVFSTGDNITDHKHLTQLIQTRQQSNPEMKITIRQFHLSSHCQHFVLHKNTYCLLLDDMLKKIEQEGAAK